MKEPSKMSSNAVLVKANGVQISEMMVFLKLGTLPTFLYKPKHYLLQFEPVLRLPTLRRKITTKLFFKEGNGYSPQIYYDKLYVTQIKHFLVFLFGAQSPSSCKSNICDILRHHSFSHHATNQ